MNNKGIMIPLSDMKRVAGEDFKRGQFVYIVKRHWLLRMLGFKPKVYVVRGP